MSTTYNYKMLQKDTIYQAPNNGRLYLASPATSAGTTGNDFSTTIFDPIANSDRAFNSLTPASYSTTTSSAALAWYAQTTKPSTASHGTLRLVGISWLNVNNAGGKSSFIPSRGYRQSAPSDSIVTMPGVLAGLYAEHYLTFLMDYKNFGTLNALFDVAILTRQFWSPMLSYPGVDMVDTPVVMPINYHIASHTTMEATNNDNIAIAAIQNSSKVKVSFSAGSTSAPFVGDFAATILDETSFFSMYNYYAVGSRITIDLKMHRDDMLAMGEEPVGWMLFNRSDADSPWEYSEFVEGDTYVATFTSVADATLPTKLIIPITRDVFINPRVIEFDPNGGSLDEFLRRKTVDVGKPYGALPTPSRFRYNFLGWFTQPTGGSLVTSETIVPDLSPSSEQQG